MARTGRVLIMAGGTGGHVFPALAVAEELRNRGLEVAWLGTRTGIEAELVPDRGFTIHYIDVKGVRGKSLAARLAAPLLIARALAQATAIVRAVRPGVALGLGGYASGPGGVAARLLGVPLVIHEQNAVAGTTNRILARIASRVLEAFPHALPGAIVTGNPVRREIADLPPPRERAVGRRDRLRLLVLGGSLGALAINELVPRALARLGRSDRIDVRHQCGRKHQTLTGQAYDAAGVKASVEPFIADMAAAYSWADFVVCRAGALTVSELAAAGVGALLIPFPAAIDDHQTLNAEVLVKGGAALLVQQDEIDPERLAAILGDLLEHPEKVATYAENARQLGIADAGARVADICVEVMK